MNNKLYVLGIGPGHLDYLTPVARTAIRDCSHIIGYELYLELIAPLVQDKEISAYNLGEESLRTRHALELALQGHNTALVCSGDPGIYAMASLVMEEMHQAQPKFDDLQVEVVPGISAVQLLAARCGAPLGHDFCCISLSDLLTPWSVIEKRIHAAGQGDFVVAFYNPISKKRDWQLAAALDILTQYRSASTPLIIGNNLSRAGETINKLTLAERGTVQADMLSIVLVGNEDTCYSQKYCYTPRGYHS